jgi:hypothetical protein
MSKQGCEVAKGPLKRPSSGGPGPFRVDNEFALLAR